MGFMCHARKRNNNGAVLKPDNRGGEAEELRSGGAIMNKLAASIISCTRDGKDLRAKQEGHHVKYTILSVTPFKYLIWIADIIIMKKEDMKISRAPRSNPTSDLSLSLIIPDIENIITRSIIASYNARGKK